MSAKIFLLNFISLLNSTKSRIALPRCSILNSVSSSFRPHFLHSSPSVSSSTFVNNTTIPPGVRVIMNSFFSLSSSANHTNYESLSYNFFALPQFYFRWHHVCYADIYYLFLPPTLAHLLIHFPHCQHFFSKYQMWLCHILA